MIQDSTNVNDEGWGRNWWPSTPDTREPVEVDTSVHDKRSISFDPKVAQRRDVWGPARGHDVS